MVSVKFLAFLVVLAVFVACIQPAEGCHLKRRKHRIGCGSKGFFRGCGLLSNRFKNRHRHRGHLQIWTDLANLKEPVNFKDSITWAWRVSFGFLNILKISFISEVADFFGKIMVAILKITVCILGPGDCSICGEEYFGIGDARGLKVSVFLDKYGLTDCRSRFLTIFNKHSLKKYRGSLRIIIDAFDSLSVILTNKITKHDFSRSLFHILTFWTAIGNSLGKDVGIDISGGFLDACGPYIVDAGYPDVSDDDEEKIKVIAQPANDDKDAPWNKEGDNDNDNDKDKNKKKDDDDDKNKGVDKKDQNKDNDNKNKDVGNKKNDNKGDDNDKKNIGLKGKRRRVKKRKPKHNKKRGLKKLRKGVKPREVVTCVGKLFDNLKKDQKVKDKHADKVTSLQPPQNFADVVGFALTMMQGFSSVINVSFIPGLGDLIVKIFVVIVKISVCLLGPGNCAVCTTDYYGVKEVSGNAVDVIKQAGLENAHAQFLEIINNKSNGKGLDFWNGPQRKLLECCERITLILNAKISQNAFVDVMVQLTSIAGLVGSTYNNGDDGVKISSGIVESVSPYLADKGYRTFTETDETTIVVTVDVVVTKTTTAPWTCDSCIADSSTTNTTTTTTSETSEKDSTVEYDYEYVEYDDVAQ